VPIKKYTRTFNEDGEVFDDDKIETIAIAASPYEEFKVRKSVGFTCGAFDVLHAGHILMLEEAKSVCDYLIVGVQSDPTVDRPEKNKPIQSYEERLIMVRSIKYIDEVRLYDTENDLLNLLQEIVPDIRIVGQDHKEKPFTGDTLDIEVYFNSRDHGYSSSDIRKRVYDAEKTKIDWNNSRR
jgi:glycerol-3-phosphate cytidylyltransferase